jgi:hypothetical protein
LFQIILNYIELKTDFTMDIINKDLIDKEIEIFEREYLEANPYLFSGMCVPYHVCNKTTKNRIRNIDKKKDRKNDKVKKLRRSARIANKLKNKTIKK